MWKHKNFINLQLYAPPITQQVFIYVNGSTTATSIVVEVAIWADAQNYNTSTYTISGNTVIWADGTILQYNGVDVLPTDTIVENGQYTTRSGVTMKSYNLSTSTKWDNLSAGNHSVTIIAKAAGYRDSASSTAITVVKGSTGETWALNNSLSVDVVSKTTIAFTSNNENFVAFAASDGIRMGPQTLWYYTNDTDYIVACEYDTWQNQAYRTITFDEPVTDTTLLTWLQANGTKQ